MSEAAKSIAVIALRQILPFLGGAAYATDENIGHLVAAGSIVVSIAYHAWQMHQGKKRQQ